VVLVVAGHCEHGVRALDAGAAQEGHFVAVTPHDNAAELAFQPVGTAAVLLDQGDLVAPLQQVARKVIADLTAADDYGVHARFRGIVTFSSSASAGPASRPR